MILLPHAWIPHGKSLANGENDFSSNACKACWSNLARGRPASFPPRVVVEVKALACELPYNHGLPLSRFSIHEIRQEVLARSIVAQVSETTLWRWLDSDAIRPWQYRSWIYPRDPGFLEKASRVLGSLRRPLGWKALRPSDYVLSADEKTSIQARIRKHPTLGPRSQSP